MPGNAGAIRAMPPEMPAFLQIHRGLPTTARCNRIQLKIMQVMGNPSPPWATQAHRGLGYKFCQMILTVEHVQVEKPTNTDESFKASRKIYNGSDYFNLCQVTIQVCLTLFYDYMFET